MFAAVHRKSRQPDNPGKARVSRSQVLAVGNQALLRRGRGSLSASLPGERDVAARAVAETITTMDSPDCPEAFHTEPAEAEAQADEIATRVAAPERASASRLPVGLAERLERETGDDFSRLRVHADEAAASKVTRYGAQAMTEDGELYFGAGQWRPDTLAGAFLAAHEAVHAAQQGFASPGPARGEARYFKKDTAPRADPRDVFDEVKKRAPDMAVFVDVKTISDAMARKGDVEGPAVAGGSTGSDVHEWHISLTLSQETEYSQTDMKPIVTTKKTRHGQLFKHVIPILWGTFRPLGSTKDYETEAASAEQSKTLPSHAPRAKDFAFELTIAEPLIHELLHARIIMEKDSTFTAAHTQVVQGFDDIIAASHQAAVNKARNAVRTRIGLLAVAHANPPKAKQLADVTDVYDSFLVHEKFDSQRVFGLMGRSTPVNQRIAEGYSKSVANRLDMRFGESTLSDAEEAKQRHKFENDVVAYFDAIDAELSKGGQPGNPAPQAPTSPAPTPAKPSE